MLKSLAKTLLTVGLVSSSGMFVAAEAQTTAQTQSNVCKGVVYDSTGEPLIGATVMVKGTTNGTSTDIDGAFNLSNVKKGATLVISYVGMNTKEIKWDGQALEVSMTDNESVLNELVVVGYVFSANPTLPDLSPPSAKTVSRNFL